MLKLEIVRTGESNGNTEGVLDLQCAGSFGSPSFPLARYSGRGMG